MGNWYITQKERSILCAFISVQFLKHDNEILKPYMQHVPLVGNAFMHSEHRTRYAERINPFPTANLWCRTGESHIAFC